jgi:hypothetical protein
MTDFHERTGAGERLQTLYPPVETTPMFSNLLDKIDAEKAFPAKPEPRGLRTMFMRTVRS